MPTSPPRDPWLSARERAVLAEGLPALDGHTEAPLRVVGLAARQGRQVFDLQEEFELGLAGRRFLLSVDPEAREALLLSMGRRTLDAA
jgi:hypothetical protein